MSDLRYCCIPIVPPSEDFDESDRGRGNCPLQNVSVTGLIRDAVAEYTVEQTYANPLTDAPIEAAYSFPLYEGVAVIGFEAEVDGRKIIGKVEEKAAAREAYDEAKKAGKVASLLEEETPDVFQASIGNIPPSKTVSIRITLVVDLKQDAEENQVRFVVPVSIAPRYGSAPELESNVDVSRSKLSVNMGCAMSKPIRSIQSPSHTIAVQLGTATDHQISDESFDPNQAQVSLTSDTLLESDIVVIVQALGLDEPRALVERHPRDGTHAIALTFAPRFALNPVLSSELIFVVDRSGSMDGARIKQAGVALELFLRSIPCDDHYINVIGFGSYHQALFPKSVVYDEENLKKGVRYAQAMEADMGGTEIESAFQEAFQRRRRDVPTQIFVLTDGEVWGVETLCATVRAAVEEGEKSENSFVRVFSLGIGDAVSHDLIESVARAGNGYAQLVLEGERMEKKVLNMLKAALVPPITDLTIQWSDHETSTASEKPNVDLGGYQAEDYVLVEPEAEDSQPGVQIPQPAQPVVVQTSQTVVEIVQPPAETIESVVEIAQTSAQTTESVVEIAQHTAESSKPVVEIAQHTAESSKPVVEIAQHSTQISEPVVEVPTKEPINLYSTSPEPPEPPSPSPPAPTPPDADIICLIQQAPFNLPILSRGARFTVYALLSPSISPPKQLILRGSSPDGPVELKVKTQPTPTSDSTTLHSLAARALVRDLEEGSSCIHLFGKPIPASQRQKLDSLGVYPTMEGERFYGVVMLRPKYVIELAKKRIVEIATKYNLSSQHTSWVAIDEASQERIVHDAVQRPNVIYMSKQAYPSVQYDSIKCFALRGSASEDFSIPLPIEDYEEADAVEGNALIESVGGAPSASYGFVAPSVPMTAPPVTFQAPAAAAAWQSSAEQSEEEEEPVVVDSSDDPHARLQSVLQQQSFDGSFPLSAEIAAFFSTSVEELHAKLEELRKQQSGLSITGSVLEKVWATCLAVEFMRKQLPDLQDEWELVVEKAERRVEYLMKGEDVGVIKQAAALIVAEQGAQDVPEAAEDVASIKVVPATVAEQGAQDVPEAAEDVASIKVVPATVAEQGAQDVPEAAEDVASIKVVPATVAEQGAQDVPEAAEAVASIKVVPATVAEQGAQDVPGAAEDVASIKVVPATVAEQGAQDVPEAAEDVASIKVVPATVAEGDKQLG